MADSNELFKNPLHPYTKALLSAIPEPDPLNEKKRTGRIDEEADGEKAFFQNQRRRYLRGLRHEPEKLLLSFPGQI